MDAQATSTKTGSEDGSLKLTNWEDFRSRFRMALIENLGSQAQAVAASGPNTKYHDVCVLCVLCGWCCGVVVVFKIFVGAPRPPLSRTPRPHPLTPFRRTAQNFALFSLSHHNFHCLGPYVEFWPKNSKRAHFSSPAPQTPPNFNERSPKRERRKKENVAGEEKKKREILRPPPFGAPPFGAPTFSRFGPKIDWPKTVSALLAPPFEALIFGPHPMAPHWPKLGKNWPAEHDGPKRIGQNWIGKSRS